MHIYKTVNFVDIEVIIELDTKDIEALKNFDSLEETINRCKVIIKRRPTMSFGEPIPGA